MPEFEYRAHDQSGQPKQGVVSATDMNAAVRDLSALGLRLQSLAPSAPTKTASAHAPRTPPVTSSAPGPMVSPAPVPSAPTQAPQAAQPLPTPSLTDIVSPGGSTVRRNLFGDPDLYSSPSASILHTRSAAPQADPAIVINRAPVAGVVRTRRLNIRQRYMLFAQMANMLRAGISPHACFAQLASYSSKPDQQAAYANIARRAGGGMALGDAMSPYIDMFQPGDVGGINAGQAGGYLPDACDAVSDQLRTLNRFRLWFWWAGLVVLASLLCIPVTLIALRGLEESAKTINTTGPMTRGITAMFHGWWLAMTGAPGVVTLVLLVLYLLMRAFWHRTEMLTARHALAERAPLSSRRSHRESVVVLAWHLELLTKAGLPPNTCWMLASRAVPNVVSGRKLVRLGERMTDQSRISDTIRGVTMFPEEFWPMVATGELTGTLPDALRQAAELSRADMQSTELHLRWRAGCWFLLLSLGTTGFLYYLFIAKYYEYALKYILKD